MRRERRRRRRLPIVSMGIVTTAISVVGMFGVLHAANSQGADVERVGGLGDVLTSKDQTVTKSADDPDGALFSQTVEYETSNYLIVGSDSRANADQFDEEVQIGDESTVGGQRSDVIMVLRQEANGPASLLSIPRDLWIDIPGYKPNKINAAFNYGPHVLTKTITEELGIPIQHYIEVDFAGFRDIIDAVGGVEMCFGHPARDKHSGLNIAAGCQVFDGTTALEFARSRYYQEWDGSGWVTDGTADRGRVLRQQLFIRAAATSVLEDIRANPFAGDDMLKAATASVRIDDQTDPIEAAQALQSAAEEGLTTYVLPTSDATKNSLSVLELGEGSSDVLAYFAGIGPAPTEYATGSTSDGGTSSGSESSTSEPDGSSSSDL